MMMPVLPLVFVNGLTRRELAIRRDELSEVIEKYQIELKKVK